MIQISELLYKSWTRDHNRLDIESCIRSWYHRYKRWDSIIIYTEYYILIHTIKLCTSCTLKCIVDRACWWGLGFIDATCWSRCFIELRKNHSSNILWCGELSTNCNISTWNYSATIRTRCIEKIALATIHRNRCSWFWGIESKRYLPSLKCISFAVICIAKWLLQWIFCTFDNSRYFTQGRNK